MKYFYSGAASSQAVQKDSNLSLGGFISSSPIPNDLLQNIFSEVSYLTIQQNKRETKLIVLQNNSTKAAINLSLTFIIGEDSLAKYKVAFVVPSDETCFELISDPSALPFEATFSVIVSGEPIVIPDMEAEGYLGLWLTRELDFESDDLKLKSCDYYQEQLNTPTILEVKDTLSVVLDYTLVP